MSPDLYTRFKNYILIIVFHSSDRSTVIDKGELFLLLYVRVLGIHKQGICKTIDIWKSLYSIEYSTKYKQK